MFWRFLDPQSPLYEKNAVYQDTVFKYYEKIDQIIGKTLKKLDKDATLIVLSDHGFTSFRRTVHLNRWLLDNEYLFLKGDKNRCKEFLEDIDWPKTRAYALGFGGIYLNKIGREYYGIVNEYEVQNLKEAIIKGLEEFRDPENGKKVIKAIYAQEDVFRGPYINDAPDLFVGFNVGFRASWQTAIGGVPQLLIEDNQRKWSGDHLVDPSLVPGLIFVNKKIELNKPSLVDIVPSILGLFNIDKPQEMQGENLFKDILRIEKQ